MQYLSLLCRKRKADVGDYWFIYNKLYDASDEGHAQVIQKYLENDPDIDPEELESMYNSNQHFRDYALNKLDGIRIAQDQVEVGYLDSSKLNKIRKAFVQIYGEDAYDMKIGIQDNGGRTYYFNVPFDDVDGSSINKLRRYKMYGAKKMQYLSLLYGKKAYDKGNYPLDSEDSGWISPAGEIYFINDIDQEHSDLLYDIHAVGEYIPSEKAFKEITKDRTEADYRTDNGGIDVEYFVEMARYDGWIRFFGGNDGRWAGVEGNLVNFECPDIESLKKLHKWFKQEKVRMRCPDLWVEVEDIKYIFSGSLSKFIETGLDLRFHKIIAKKKKSSSPPQIDDTMSGWITPSGEVLVLEGEDSHLQTIRELYSNEEYVPSEEAISKFNKGETKRILPEATPSMAIYDGYIRFFGGHNDLWIGTPENTVSFEVSSMSEVQILQKYIVRGLLKPSVKNIEVETLNRRYYFTGTPQEYIDTGLDATLHRRISKKADFSGDFQNVYDVRPDPGNVIPGRNREYVKQQTDFFPHKTSGEEDEFVHTHPEHCPRYDLRKLKIVDDPDESESEFSEDGE